MKPRSRRPQSRPLKPAVRWPRLVLLTLAIAAPAAALDQVWDTVRVAGHSCQVQVVSTRPLGGSFPDRPLAFGSDAGMGRRADALSVLEQLDLALVGRVSDAAPYLTGAVAHVLLLETIAQERGLMRMSILEDRRLGRPHGRRRFRRPGHGAGNGNLSPSLLLRS